MMVAVFAVTGTVLTAKMYFNYRLFFKALRLALFQQPFHVRRWAYVIFFTVLYLAFLSVVILGRVLDQIFFSGFRKQKVANPVFVIAPPRSGTTLVQNLLSLDDQRFVHLKMYQTIFPSVFYQRLFDAVIWVDRILGCPFSTLLGWCEKKWFGGWDDLHKLRLNQPEEDDALFLYAFESEAIFMLFPFVEELWEAGFPDALPSQDRRRLMQYYRSCLQRHIYANGPSKTLLSKATQSSGTLESLLEEFPDAKFVTIIRHPYRSVASHVSLFVPVWQAHSPEIAANGPVARAYAKLAVEWYKHLYAFRLRVDPSRYCCIDYRDLVRNPAETIRKLYQHFDWLISDGYGAKLDRATQKQREFKSKHEYTLEQFGLSREWIQKELGEILDAYGLERDAVELQELDQQQSEPVSQGLNQ
jgi:omega-hydroxy-beta-dihydromenaquinone-9 sulfotransferase